jgi:hypothetical protein
MDIIYFISKVRIDTHIFRLLTVKCRNCNRIVTALIASNSRWFRAFMIPLVAVRWLQLLISI